MRMCRFTVFSDGCWWSLQHVLSEVNKNLVELSTTQQVEVLNDLEEDTNNNNQQHCSFCTYLIIQNQPWWVQTLSCSSRSDSSTINVQRCCKLDMHICDCFVLSHSEEIEKNNATLNELTSATVLLMRSIRFSKSTRLKSGCCLSLCSSEANRSSWCFSMEPEINKWSACCVILVT